MSKFWNVKTEGDKASLDLFGYVGGSKEWGDGFNETEFLNDFRKIPVDSALDISINSFGGAVYTALSIFSLLKSHKGKITIRVDGAAMSAATIITSVPNAKVIMPKGSMMMIHKVSSIAIGTTDDMRKTADDMEKLEENILSIYAEKTGHSVEEVKEKVDAETYFTAEEAVKFGLADEIDEATAVTNVASGEFVMLNGLKAPGQVFAHAPEGLIQAEPKASADKKEVCMDLETLKAEYPDLVEAIRKEALAEGAKAERTRIKDIEECALAGYEDLVAQAKYGEQPMTASDLAVAIVKAEKSTKKRKAVELNEDAQVLDKVALGDGNEGITNDANEAEHQAIIAAGARGYSK